MPTTLQQLQDAWEIEIFPSDSDDEFVKLCAKREQHMKIFLNNCWKEIMLHTDMPSLSNKQLVGWRKEKIDKNQKNFLLYLDELVEHLKKGKIEQYISENQNNKPLWFPFEPDVLLFTYNSYYGSVLTDIFWIGDLTVAHVIQISKRQLDLAILGKYVTGQIDKIKKLLAEHKTIYANHDVPIPTLEEAFTCHQRGLFKGFNLIMITTIEGIVRSFGEYLIKKQNIVPEKISHSLDSFLKNTPWATDLEIDKIKYFSITGDYNYGDRISQQAKRHPEPKTIKVTYQTRLDFLGRGFKERRNLLAHGKEVEYENTLQGLINAAALVEILETIVEYTKTYK
ncbi:MAG TPA: hypothetical protein VL832_04055 [Puia sp.]|jgi:hypothetical protein|nr:hypothetical protein [Puia sp.]